METLIKHKWKAIIATSLLGVISFLYKTRRQSQPNTRLKLAPKENPKADIKVMVYEIRKNIRESIGFVNEVLLETVPLRVLENKLNVTFEFNTTEELLLVLDYVFTEIIVQRFVFLISLVKNAIKYRNCQKIEAVGEEVKDTVKSNNNFEEIMFFKAIKEYIGELVEEIHQYLKEYYVSKLLTLSNKEAIDLLTILYDNIRDEYWKLSLKEGMEALELESYHLKLVNRFTMKLKSASEVKEFIESVYFQSLVMQGMDIDFYKFNAEYQRIIPLAYQGRDINESINNRDVVAAMLKGYKEFAQKRLIRYENEIGDESDIDCLEKMIKFIAPELNKSQNETNTSEVYKKQLKSFIKLISS